jgi:hypothetical protein
MSLNTETSTSDNYEVFLLFRLQSLWNLGTKHFSGLTPPAYDWLVTLLELNLSKSKSSQSHIATDGQSVSKSWCWSLPAQSFSGPSSLGLLTIFYCLRYETSLFVASYDSQGHGGGIRPRLHAGLTLSQHSILLLCTDPRNTPPLLLLTSLHTRKYVYTAVA